MTAAPASIPHAHLTLLAHGSRNPRWPDGLAPLLTSLRAELGDAAVSLCFLELLTPSLADVAAAAAAAGARELAVLPMFWSDEGHVLRDLPAIAASITVAFPTLRLRILPAVGVQPAVHAAIATLARAAAAASSAGDVDR